MHSTFKRVAAGVTAFAVASVTILSASAQALPPGSPAEALAPTLSPANGKSSTTFSLTPPAAAACQGDSATNGYRWQTFMVAAAVDAGTLTYNTSGPLAVGSDFVQPLYSGGTPVAGQLTDAVTGFLGGIPTYNMSVFAPGFVPAGNYKMGYACTLAGATTRYWQMTFSVATTSTTTVGGPARIIYGQPAAAFAPTVGALTAGDQSLGGTLTDAGLSIPGVTGYTITATPFGAGSGAAVTPAPLTPAAAGAFSFSGLTNGVSYAVKATATNSVGTSPDSNTVNGTPNPLPYLPVTALSRTVGINQVTLTWTNPSDLASHPLQVPAGYDVVVTGAGAGTGTFNGNSGIVISGLTAGVTYTFTVQPKYTLPYSAPVASTTGVANPPTLLFQDINVTRPVGALVITQRCGVFAARTAEAATATFPAIPGLAASADLIGTAPTTGAAAGGPADGLFGQYPYPVDSNGLSNAVYPTHCGINLGIGRLVTAGTYAGDYFAAYGQIHQVTVVDTRDTDPGWTVTGTMSNFTKTGVSSGGTPVSGTQSFSGDYLGWSPALTGDSGASMAGYNQTVTLPVGTVAPTTTAGAGLTSGKVMANAAPGVGMGIATLDAGLKLLIPLTAVNGVYTAVLTFSAV